MERLSQIPTPEGPLGTVIRRGEHILAVMPSREAAEAWLDAQREEMCLGEEEHQEWLARHSIEALMAPVPAEGTEVHVLCMHRGLDETRHVLGVFPVGDFEVENEWGERETYPVSYLLEDLLERLAKTFGVDYSIDLTRHWPSARDNRFEMYRARVGEGSEHGSALVLTHESRGFSVHKPHGAW